MIGGGDTKRAHIVQVNLNTAGDSSCLQSSLRFSIGSSVTMLVAFTLSRRWNLPVHSREGRVSYGFENELPEKSWLSQVLSVAGDVEVREVGLDGWSLIEFRRLHRRMLCVIGPPVLLVICPVNWAAPAPQLGAANP